MHKMDDLELLRQEFEAPAPPSPSAYAAARAALLHRASDRGAHPAGLRARQRPRRTRLMAVAAAMTASAAALAIVFGSVELGDSTTEPAPDLAASGHDVLLAAATTALEQPDNTGEYWYLREEFDDPALELDSGQNPQTLETWVARDGEMRSKNQCCEEVYLLAAGPAGFPVGASLLTYEQLGELPTDAEELKAWVTESATDPAGWADSAPDAPRANSAGSPDGGRVASMLAELLYRAPVSPEVRAAAFNALASMPEVTNLGEMAGGLGLQISVDPPAADKYADGEVPEGSDRVTLVIDPSTATLLSMAYADTTTTIHAAEWTDQAPPVNP